MTTSANEKDIKSVVGADVLLKLSAAYGGISFLILLDGNSLRRISAVIGQDKAEKFCQHFNGAKVYFPKQEKLKKEYRDRAIIKDYTNGKSPVELAFEHGLTERTIYLILKKPL